MNEILSTEISVKKYIYYFEQLTKDKYPELYEKLLKYSKLKSLEHLKYKGMFCGMDYVGIEMLKPGDYYSRYDHSWVCALITLLATGSLIQAIAALFHDRGVYPFAHIKSYKERNEAKQDKDEMDVRSIILKDKESIRLLLEDRITIDKVCNASKYPIVDKDRPALCVDRLDGIFSAAYIWTKEFDLEMIEGLFELVAVCSQKENGNYLIDDPLRKNYDIELCLQDYFNYFEDYNTYINVICN